MPIDPKEDIVRAICTESFDNERLSSSLFKGENTSVSRLAIIPLKEHWEMFRKHVAKPPQRQLLMIGEINVLRLQELGKTHETPHALTVEPRPEDWNPAHAEIPQKISRGLANKINSALKLHHPPNSA